MGKQLKKTGVQSHDDIRGVLTGFRIPILHREVVIAMIGAFMLAQNPQRHVVMIAQLHEALQGFRKILAFKGFKQFNLLPIALDDLIGFRQIRRHIAPGHPRPHRHFAGPMLAHRHTL